MVPIRCLEERFYDKLKKRKGKNNGIFKFLGNAFADGMEDTYDKNARKTDDPKLCLMQ